MTEEQAFGISELLDENGEPVIGANGNVLLTEQFGSMLQSIKLRLLSYKGSLYWDREAGISWQDYEGSRMFPEDFDRLQAEVQEQALLDYRVASVSTKINYDVESGTIFMLLMIVEKLTKEVVKIVIDREIN